VRETFAMEKRYVRKDGSLVWVNMTSSLMRAPDGVPEYFITVVEDISQRKQAEEALQHVVQDLRRSNADLEQFAYVASHDLQEPLRMVASYTQLLSRRYRGRLDSDADDYIAFAVGGAMRMQRLISDLLSYSRVGTRGKPFQRVDTNDLLRQVCASLGAAIEESQAIITHDDLPMVLADEGQLGQLFQNLVGNAIKFRGPQPPRVHMSARHTSGVWEFAVRDNGIGIDQEHFDRIFVIFQRLHNRDQYPGTGIGLAICKKIVERHGGRIWVQSQPGQGATFYFTLPDPAPPAMLST
jgi:light-regulated signal transduction histidine kinase (bacteriophytochrome)